MSGDKQGVDTQTHRGVRGQTTTFLTALDTHTHTIDLCFCPWTYSKNRLNQVNAHSYVSCPPKCYHTKQIDSGLGYGMTFSMRSTAVFSFHIQPGLFIVLVDWTKRKSIVWDWLL